jgi:uncharacterized protein YjbJ (UPF0337 family)
MANRREVIMGHLGDSKLQGQVEEIVGGIKERIGKATGNPRMEAEGLAEQAKGKALQAKHEAKEVAGKVGEAVRDAAGAARREAE